ncbi:DNA-binding Lrp family transcriptional regulator [Curtobacterium pusillum]|uniref:DNA-binding Lrp family transcriptional regulator n=1 Tax=Curtobacterium pusillum TaxID=69373 RepID=A0AAW3T9C1_9MICO|nr:Lrp/AsnC family transcriptional regulator [Curtobacterium pusillum]MBA8991464.1 DNA-binding Lrp family transcriptional regulator [Curtobacterium pusillum]
MQDHSLSVEERRLLHALQIQPRAPWSAIAAALGSDAVTVARRWTRLQERGVAWIAVYRAAPSVTTALVEVQCPPSETMRIVEELTHDPEVLTIDVTTGGRDLLLTLVCDSRDALARYVLERMGTLPEIRALRTHIATATLADARKWRLRELDSTETAALEPSAPPARLPSVPPEVAARIRDVLARDPRITITGLAAELGTTPPRASAMLASVLASGEVVLRTEIARPLSGWPVYAWYFLDVDPLQRTAAVQRLTRLGESRLVASIVGGYDIALAVWLRSIDDVARIETFFAEHVPGVSVADRSVVLRTPYHLQKRIDAQGRYRPTHPEADAEADVTAPGP